MAGQWNYSRVYDANDNGVIDATDIQLFALEWGWTLLHHNCSANRRRKPSGFAHIFMCRSGVAPGRRI